MLRLINHLGNERKANGKGGIVNWSEVQMKGRTTKALQNQWTRIQGEIVILMAKSEEDGGAKAPVATREFPNLAPSSFLFPLVISLTFSRLYFEAGLFFY